jgi:hypothetical protein
MPNGDNKGYALVYLKDAADRKRVLEALDGAEIDGERIRAHTKLTYNVTEKYPDFLHTREAV